MFRTEFEDESSEYYAAEVDALYDKDCDHEEMRQRLGKKVLSGREAIVLMVSLGRKFLSDEDKNLLLRQGLMEKNLMRKVLAELPVEEGRELEETLNEAMGAVTGLVEQYLPLVFSVAKRYKGKGLASADLIQEGNIGLLRAAAKYDYRRTKFITHATWWVRQAMTRALQNKSNTIRLPANTTEKRRSIKKAVDTLKQLGREVTEKNISEVSGLLPQTIVRVNQSPEAVEFPDRENGDKGDNNLISMAIRVGRVTERQVEQDGLEELVAEIFDYLPGVDQRFADMLMMRHYETDEKGEYMSMKKIGKRLGRISKQRVQKLLVSAYQFLKDDEFYGPQLHEWLYGE